MISIFYRELHLAVDVTTLPPGSNKRPPWIKYGWSKNSSGLLQYGSFSVPTSNKNVKRESYILITTKTNCKSGPAWPTCFHLPIEWRNVTFFKQRKTCRPDETWLLEYFGLCPFIWFTQNPPPTVKKLFLNDNVNDMLIACFE